MIVEAVGCDVELDCINVYHKMWLLLCTHPAPFLYGKGDVFFNRSFQSHCGIWAQRKKRCLSAEEMNQFASMNHHSVSRNSSSICSGSWPFVARFSLSVCCFTHIAQLRGGKSPSECRASINPTRSRPGLTRSL